MSARLFPILLLAALFSGCTRRQQEPQAGHDPVQDGWEHYRLGEFDSAVRAFDSALATLPAADPHRDLALYGRAATWNLRTPIGDQDKTQARLDYEQIVAQAPTNDLAAWSLLALARMQHVVPVGEEPDYAAVRAAYRKVIAQFPEHLAGHEAFIYLQSTFIQTLQPEPTRQAVTALKDFIARHPQSGFISAAYALLAAGAETLHDPEAQLDAEIKSLEAMEIDPTNPTFENSANYWKIATIAEFEVGDFATARRYYARLMKEYPQDIRVFECEEALKRMDATEARLRAQPDGAGA